MAFIAITIAIVIHEWSSSGSDLDIVLRCDEGVSGWLSVISVIPDCDGRWVEESFDVEAACEKGSVEYSRYARWAGVSFTLKRENSEEITLVSEYGPDIQSDDRHGFFVVIRILNAPPFLANDSI